jgi:hypothetical protein
LNSPPLIPLKKDHIDLDRSESTYLSRSSVFMIDRLYEGVPRGKMRLLMDLVAPEIRRDALHLISHFFISSYKWAMQDAYDSQIGVVYTHQKASRHDVHRVQLTSRQGAGPFIDSLRRKWDFKRDRPLPQGVEQDWSGEGLWKKSELEDLPQA